MNFFKTSDLYLACYLRCIGFEMIGTERRGRRLVFVFRDWSDSDHTKMSFYNDEGSVRPLSFVRVIKEMKSLIHNK